MDALQPGGALGDVEVALDPAELEGLDEAGVRALYEQRLEEQRAAHSREARPALGFKPCSGCKPCIGGGVWWA